MSQAEDEIRAKAHELLDEQYVQNHAAIRRYLMEIPVNRIGMKYCPVCESVACGVCGKCHELDHEFLFIELDCPLAVETRGMSACVAWSWAYIFLRRAEKALSIQG
jgi:hypothetical protein